MISKRTSQKLNFQNDLRKTPLVKFPPVRASFTSEQIPATLAWRPNHHGCLSLGSESHILSNIKQGRVKIACEHVCMPGCLVAQSCLTLFNPTDCSSPGSSVHGIFPDKNTGVGCHALLQGIFPTQGSNLSLLCLLQLESGFFTADQGGQKTLYKQLSLFSMHLSVSGRRRLKFEHFNWCWLLNFYTWE